MMRALVFLPAAFWVAACATSENPADGGFASGISGVTGGIYEQRIDTRETRVETLRQEGETRQVEQTALAARQDATSAEITRLEQELADLKRWIVESRFRIPDLPPPVAERADAVITERPEAGPDDDSRIASLQRAIRNARMIAEELARIDQDQT